MTIELYTKCDNAIVKEEMYLAPSAYEAGFLSNAHSDDDLDKTISAASLALSSI